MNIPPISHYVPIKPLTLTFMFFFAEKSKLCHRFLFTHLASNLSSENGMFSW